MVAGAWERAAIEGLDLVVFSSQSCVSMSLRDMRDLGSTVKMREMKSFACGLTFSRYMGLSTSPRAVILLYVWVSDIPVNGAVPVSSS